MNCSDCGTEHDPERLYTCASCGAERLCIPCEHEHALEHIAEKTENPGCGA